MSLEMRQSLQGTLIFQNPVAQRHQLTELGSNGADFALHTDLISVMHDMMRLGMKFVITALRDDHSVDGCLGPDNHNPAGKAMDFWFLDSNSPIDYMDPESSMFAHALGLLKSIPLIEAVGLGGSSQIPMLEAVLGSLYFSDNGADHLHIQVR